MATIALASVIFLAGLGRRAPPSDTSEIKSYVRQYSRNPR